jgi:8-oxo-dGTP pyrophosphatase MutT (NUDIX family)
MTQDDMRKAIQNQLRALPAPADLREQRSRLCALDWLARLPRPFDRLASPVHVTGAAIVVGVRGTVLLEHRRLGIWVQPGGHLEPGEPPARAALREASEETGLDLRHPPGGPRLVHVDVHPGAEGHVHLDLRFLLLGPDREPSPPAGESPHVRWFDWPSALAVADDGLAAGLRRICSGAQRASGAPPAW